MYHDRDLTTAVSFLSLLSVADTQRVATANDPSRPFPRNPRSCSMIHHPCLITPFHPHHTDKWYWHITPGMKRTDGRCTYAQGRSTAPSSSRCVDREHRPASADSTAWPGMASERRRCWPSSDGRLHTAQPRGPVLVMSRSKTQARSATTAFGLSVWLAVSPGTTGTSTVGVFSHVRRSSCSVSSGAALLLLNFARRR